MWNVPCPAGKSPVQAKYFFLHCADTNFKARGREGGRRDIGARSRVRVGSLSAYITNIFAIMMHKTSTGRRLPCVYKTEE